MKTTKEFFDARAEIWDEITHYNLSSEGFRQLISLVEARRGKSIVDLGCGTGVLIPYLVEAVGNEGRIFAVDVSDRMLEILIKKHSYKNIRPLAVSAESMRDIPTHSTDATICFCAFPHFEDKDAALSEISRITKRSGRFLVSHLESREALNNFHMGMEEPICNHYLPDYDEMKMMFKRHSFEIIHYLNTDGRYELLAQKS